MTYSDNVDNGDQVLSSDHENSIPGKSKSMQFFDIDAEEDHAVHDQLPSIEEVKANTQLDVATRRRQRNKRLNKKLLYLLWGIVIVGVFAVFAMRSTGMEKQKRYQTAVALITKTVRLSQPEAFLDSKSPQSMALRWMLHEDALQLPLPENRYDPFVQRYVIAVMVFSLTTANTKASLSPVPSSWKNTRDVFRLLSGEHECEWNSLWARVDEDVNPVVKKERVRMGIICGFSDEVSNDGDVSNQSVTDIFFRRSGLTGELPPELEFLSHLSRVDLANNNIKGMFPPMPYLKELSLAHNLLTGYLPDHFSRMTRLRSLSMSENALQGSIPHEFADLTDLQILALNGNQLTGGLEDLYSLTNIEELYLAYNSFEEHLSHGSFQELSSLRVIDAKDNRLSGALPNALWKLSHLEVMDFHKNALDGHINNVQVEQHPLKYFDVSNNLLGGGLTSSISNLSGLTHLDVSYNRLNARIPNDSLAGMTKMKTLLLTEDDGMGAEPLPDWLRGMTDLKQLSFRLATRTGTIPTWFGELTQLELLDLDWNHISGTIPTELGLLTNLKYLMLNRNLLTGTVPTVLSYLPDLKLLTLDTNEFDHVVLIGEEDVCNATGTGGRIKNLIADCGRLQGGLPTEREVECPCCTSCCWDSAQRCNMKDWIIELEKEYRSSYDRYEYDFGETFYVPASRDDGLI